MRPSSAYRSPKIPGAWLAIDTTDGRSPRVSSRPYSTLSQIENDARSFPRPGILPQKYDKSERLHLELWDPHRLAAHVMATLSPEDERAAAVDFILENKISGAFLAHYTYDIDAIFPDAIQNTEIIRLIAQTIPHIFWIKPCEPPTLRCNLREIVKEIRASKTNPIYTSTTKHARPSLVSDWEQEEVEVELASLDPIDAASDACDGASSSDASGCSESGTCRAGVWAWMRRTVCLPQSTFEDWGATFTFISELIRGRRDRSREIFNPQTHQHSSPRARDPYSNRAVAGM